MGIDNEQKLQTVIDEAKLSRFGSLNKQEMIQIILDFQDSLRINPEHQFNQQWTGNGNQIGDNGEVDQE